MGFSREEKQFLSSASVGIILPQNTIVPLSETLRDGEDEISLQDIRQRKVLFFDERLTGHVVLRLPQCDEDTLRSYLSRLELKVEAWAIKESEKPDHQSGTAAPARDLIYSGTVKQHDDPLVLVSQDDAGEDIYLNLVWEILVILNRPRVRLQDASTVLIPKATVSPIERAKSNETYLEPFKPQITNLLEPLKGSRRFENETPYLPVNRLESVLPMSSEEDHTFQIKSAASRPIPIHPPFITRLKYAKSNVDEPVKSLMASLDIEMVPFIKVTGVIESAQATLQRGSVAPLLEDMMPIDCQSKDCITFLYQLEPSRTIIRNIQALAVAYVDTLNISVRVQLRVSPECQPLIQMNWTTTVDFSNVLTSMPHPPGQSSSHPDRLPNLSIESTNQSISGLIGTSLQPTAHTAASTDLTISFSAPLAPVKVGVPFVWQVLAMNRTAKAAKLAIIPLPRIPKPTTQAQQYAKRHATKLSITSHQSERNVGGAENPDKDIAQAVLDENVVYAMHHSGAVPPETDIISLTPEIRVGPLGPGQCHQCEIKMVAFKSGAFTLDAVRVVDLVKESEEGYGNPGVVTDIRELPDVIVENGDDSEDSNEIEDTE